MEWVRCCCCVKESELWVAGVLVGRGEGLGEVAACQIDIVLPRPQEVPVASTRRKGK